MLNTACLAFLAQEPNKSSVLLSLVLHGAINRIRQRLRIKALQCFTAQSILEFKRSRMKASKLDWWYVVYESNYLETIIPNKGRRTIWIIPIKVYNITPASWPDVYLKMHTYTHNIYLQCINSIFFVAQSDDTLGRVVAWSPLRNCQCKKHFPHCARALNFINRANYDGEAGVARY
jgi:hypothetical protein